LSKWIVFALVMLVLVPIISSADEDLNVNYNLFEGGIVIYVDSNGQYLSYVDFYKGRYDETGVNVGDE